MLLWCWVLSIFGFSLSRINYKNFYNNNIEKNLSLEIFFNYNLVLLFFSFFLVLTSSPFIFNILNINIIGSSLSPVLQDIGLAIHPPMIYLGYICTTIPFVIVLAYLKLKYISLKWLNILKIYVLISWIFLTFGITLGSWWAYYELGWGGWWFWDPVENASLIPWILNTGLLHSLWIYKKSNKFITWIILYAILNFISSILGTFIVRSNFITTVHSFTSSQNNSRTISIIIFLVLLFIYSIYYWFKNKNILSLNNSLNIFVIEGIITIQQIFFLVIYTTILLGTLFPILLKIFTDRTISIGQPFFHTTLLPFIFILLFFLIFIPFYKKNNKKTYFKKNILFISYFLILTLLSFNLFYFTLEYLFFIIANLIIYSIIIYSINFNIQSIISHFGIALFTLACGLNNYHKEEFLQMIKLGDEIKFSNYNIIFRNISLYKGPNYSSIVGNFIVYPINDNKEMKNITILFPEKRIYNNNSILITKNAIYSNYFSDLSISMGDEINNEWIIKYVYNPGMLLIWFSGFIIGLGGIISLFKKLSKFFIFNR
jgi:cytochrome c-type biogenesis protein CcmF